MACFVLKSIRMINLPLRFHCGIHCLRRVSRTISDCFTLVPRTRIDCFDFDDYVTGFGFSAIANDYKIVRAYEFNDLVDGVEVFSLSRGSWKEIDVGNLKGVILHSETVTANGAIFWSGLKIGAEKDGEHNSGAKEDEDDVEVIVSFDVAKEVFKLMPRPVFGNKADQKLTVYENKLAILCDIWDADHEMSDLIDLWEMEEVTCAFGERQSWTKIYTSSPCSYILHPVTIWRNKIVCKAYSEDGKEEEGNVLYLMNVTTDEAKRFVISIGLCTVFRQQLH